MDINRKKRNRLYVIVFILYMVFLMYFLFFSDLFGRTVVYEDYRYNLEPFKEIQRFCTTVKEKDYLMFLINIVGNVALFIPFGYLFSTLNEKRKRKRVLSFFLMFFWTLVFCMAVETCQLVSKVGVFDIDDIILNVSGAVLGFVAYTIVRMRREAFARRLYESAVRNPRLLREKSE